MTQTKVEATPKAAVEEQLRSPAAIETRPVHVSDLALASSALIDDPRFDEDEMQKRFSRRQRLIKLCFQMTSPSQWVKFEDAKTGKATVYPMGGAADAIILHILGCVWRDEVIMISKRDDQGQPTMAESTGWLVAMSGEEKRIAQFTGYREMGGFVKTEPDLKKGARENMKSVAVRDLLGLRGRSPDELAALGLNLSQVGSATFQNNKAGPGEVPVFAFGKKKGLAANDPKVTKEDLLWYAERCKESIADPEKAKWKKSEEKKLEAYRAEYQRRIDLDKKPKAAALASDDFAAADFPHDPETGEIREPGAEG